MSKLRALMGGRESLSLQSENYCSVIKPSVLTLWLAIAWAGRQFVGVPLLQFGAKGLEPLFSPLPQEISPHQSRSREQQQNHRYGLPPATNTCWGGAPRSTPPFIQEPESPGSPPNSRVARAKPGCDCKMVPFTCSEKSSPHI